MSMRQNTVKALRDKLTAIMEMTPEAAEYIVVMESTGGEIGSYPWRGTTFRWDEYQALELEVGP